MARKKENSITKESKPEDGSLVVNQYILQSVDRSKKDIQNWRWAHINAEAIEVPNRTRLYDLYKDVELDGHITGIVEKRIATVLNKSLHFEINGKQVDEMDDVIGSDAFRNVIRQVMLQKFWGLSGMEFIPGDKLMFEEIERKHIKPHLKLITREQNGEEGWPYHDAWNLWIIGDNRDLGLFLKLSPYALWKRGTLGDGAQYVEIFGQPVIVMKYDTYDNKTKIELEQAMTDAGSSLRLMIPKQAEFEIVDGKQTNGDGKLYETFVRIFNNEMSIMVLGNTETTSNENGGSNAKAREHAEQQMEIVKMDLKDVLNALNSDKFLSILKSYALPVEGGRFVYAKEFDPVQLKADKEIDAWLGNIVPLGDDYYYGKYGRPKPANYEELKAKMEADKQAKLNAHANPANNTPAAEKDKASKKPKNLIAHAALEQQLSALYGADCCALPDLAEADDFETIITRLLREIYRNQSFVDSPASLRQLFIDKLWDAVEQGYGQTMNEVDFDSPDFQMLEALRVDVIRFSSAKNEQMNKSLYAELKDGNGRVRGWAEFRNAAYGIADAHSHAWLQAERNLAITSAQAASMWTRFTQFSDTLPLLQFDAVMDDATTAICRNFNGVTLPINHAFWDTYFIPNHWGERSTIRQVGEGAITDLSAIVFPDKMHPMFKVNLAKEKRIFPGAHPYYGA